MKRFLPWLAAAWMGCGLVAAAATAAPATQPDNYIRCIDNGAKGGELDTADVAFVNDSGVSVHLVAAVHIGEHSYYQELNSEFANYDAVLYELIKPRDAAPPAGNGAGENSTNLVSRFQRFLKDTLNLDYQLDVIDYTRPNFVNADLDKETFEKMEADRGESLTSLMMQQIMQAWTNPPVDTGPQESTDEQARDLVKLLCRPDGERRMKMALAHQMDQIEDATAGLGGPNGTVILTERNKAAIGVFKQTLGQGKRKIAIFYGAAHMPDLARQLAGLGFHPVGTEWHRAWDLTFRADEPSNAERLMNSVLGAFDESTGNGN